MGVTPLAVAERNEAILFDIDGTLLRTGGAGARAWDRALTELHGRGIDIERETESGMTDPEVGRVALQTVLGRDATRSELVQALAGYQSHLAEQVNSSPRFRVMPGLPGLLEELVERGYLVGLVTGNLEAAAHIKLARAGINRFFSFGGYGSDSDDRVEVTRRALERASVVSGGTLDWASCLGIGDTPRDIDAAHGAGIVSVAVATGDYSVDQLTAAGADHVLDSLLTPLPL